MTEAKRELVERLARKAGLHPMPLNIKEFERLAELVAEECAKVCKERTLKAQSLGRIMELEDTATAIRSKFCTT